MVKAVDSKRVNLVLDSWEGLHRHLHKLSFEEVKVALKLEHETQKRKSYLFRLSQRAAGLVRADVLKAAQEGRAHVALE